MLTRLRLNIKQVHVNRTSKIRIGELAPPTETSIVQSRFALVQERSMRQTQCKQQKLSSVSRYLFAFKCSRYFNFH